MIVPTSAKVGIASFFNPAWDSSQAGFFRRMTGYNAAVCIDYEESKAMKTRLFLARAWFAFGGLLVGACPTQLQAQTNLQTDITAELSQRTTEFIARFEREAAQWTTTCTLKDAGVTFEFSIVDAQKSRSTTITVSRKDVVGWRAQIVEQDGHWYVTEPTRKYLCRPFEAPLGLTALYSFLPLAELSLFDSAAFPDNSKWKVTGDSFTCRSPLPDETVSMLRSSIAAAQQVIDRVDAKKRVELEQQINLVNEQIKTGSETSFSPQGFVSLTETSRFRLSVTDFEWRGKQDAPRIDQGRWKPLPTSLSDDIDSVNLMLCAHYPTWIPGQRPGDTDNMLVDIESGKFKRLPCHIGITTGGCFSPDRNAVYTSAHDAAAGGLIPVRVDLQTGENSLLTPQLPHGVYLFPQVSNSGEWLVVLQGGLGQERGVLAAQVYLIHLPTGRAQQLSTPMDCAHLAWLPDDSGIVLVNRDLETPGEERGMICRITLNGELTPICPGDCPVVLRDRQRMAYLDAERRWHTCDLNGNDTRLLGDGLQRFLFATASPDGDRLVMMKFGGDRGPRPHVIDVETGDANEIPVPDGFWAMPNWR